MLTETAVWASVCAVAVIPIGPFSVIDREMKHGKDASITTIRPITVGPPLASVT